MANPSNANTDDGFRHIIALTITGFSIVVVGTIAGLAISYNHGNPAETMNVLAAVLPVIGTWIGTVIAFYFGKENFEAATRSAQALVSQLTPEQRLQSKPVTAVMIPLANMHKEIGTTIVLATAIDNLQKSGKGDRIPVLDTANHPVLVVHLSTIDRFLREQALKGTQNLDKLTLDDLLKYDDLKKQLDESFEVVNDIATLEDAKKAMDVSPHCQDVFVTKGGTKNEAVIGWITNDIIEDNAKV
jgi:hypothetical protein